MPEILTDYSNFTSAFNTTNYEGLYIPPGWSGTYPGVSGTVTSADNTFLSIRPWSTSVADYAEVQNYLNGGSAPVFNYHRFWAEADIATAFDTFAYLFPNVSLLASATTTVSVTNPGSQAGQTARGGQPADPGDRTGERQDPHLQRHRPAARPVDQLLDRGGHRHPDRRGHLHHHGEASTTAAGGGVPRSTSTRRSAPAPPGQRQHRDRPPTPASQSGTVGTAASLQIQATDSATGQTLSYSAAGLLAGLTAQPHHRPDLRHPDHGGQFQRHRDRYRRDRGKGHRELHLDDRSRPGQAAPVTSPTHRTSGRPASPPASPSTTPAARPSTAGR